MNVLILPVLSSSTEDKGKRNENKTGANISYTVISVINALFSNRVAQTFQVSEYLDSRY